MEVILHEATRESESAKHSENGEPLELLKSPNDMNGASVKAGSPENVLKPLDDAVLPRAIDIHFKDIRYTATLGLFRKEKKEILHGIHGRLPAGRLIAIMGPSGAGKSTLLDILSGYRIRGVTGTVYVNGLTRNLKSFRKSSCYIQQDDRLQPLLTTLENMRIAADIKLPPEVTKQEKEETINGILNMLGLEGTQNTKAGGLSGGQRKRLSIALELVNNPTVMFLDEPTTGLDSFSCTQCIKLLKQLAEQGRTIICTIHQPSASLFQIFDQVYVLSGGRCLYQGSTEKLLPFLNDVNHPCPQYHNPADFVIELACEEYGPEIVNTMVDATRNGQSLTYFNKDVQPALNNSNVSAERSAVQADDENVDEDGLQATSSMNQLKILLRRGFIKMKRDQTLTHMRVIVNVLVGIMLGTLCWKSGSDGSKVLENFNLLFCVVMHHMMSTMMLTIVTYPSELSILIKEHFNRWYSLKMYYTAVNLLDIPMSILSCLIFTVIIYFTSDQPPELNRFCMFFVISLLVVFVAQSFGFMIGSLFNVVNGTFMGPTLSVPMMMFAGFGVTLKDLPPYLYWGTYISYLKYGFEGLVGSIYGLERETIPCPDGFYCHYKYPSKLLNDVAIKGDQFGNDVIALVLILFFLRILAFVLLRYKLNSLR